MSANDQIERELASGGFCWEPKRFIGRPFSVRGMKKPKSRPRTEARREYDRQYNLNRRRHRLLLGIVKPKDEAEREWLAAEQRRAAA